MASTQSGLPSAPISLSCPCTLSVFFKEISRSVLTQGPRPQAPLPFVPKHTGLCPPRRAPRTHTSPIVVLDDVGTHRAQHHKNKQACDLHPPHTAPAREKRGPESHRAPASVWDTQKAREPMMGQLLIAFFTCSVPYVLEDVLEI